MSAIASEVAYAHSEPQAGRKVEMLRGGLIALGLVGILMMPAGQLLAKATTAWGVDAVLTAEQLQAPAHVAIVMRARHATGAVLVRATAIGGALVAMLAFGTLYLANRFSSGTDRYGQHHVTCSSTESST